MKIIQLNIWGGKLGMPIVEFLKSEKPDFVCMQEVNDLEGSAGYKFFAPLEEIRAEAGFAYSSMSASYSSRYMERELEYGNAILSQHPFTSEETVFTNGKYRRNFDIEKDGSNIRNLQVVKVKAGAHDLNILNHHGFHIMGSKEGSPDTVRAALQIAEIIDSLDGPIIMCGDFNLTPSSESIGILDNKLTNLSALNKLERTYNQFSAVYDVCDYIFVSEDVKVKHFSMSEVLLSDHKALILEFEL